MIEVTGLSKSFPARSGPKKSLAATSPDSRVLKSIDMTIKDGEFFCLLGGSGCGKTTLLRLVAGLEKPDVGTIHIDNVDVTALPPHKRGCAMVFQNYALWPHLTVGENIVYGLEVQKKTGVEIERVLTHLLATYQLVGLEKRLPHQLSGGQQQRVALARAMAMEPRALLMDEPFSNLDASLRTVLRRDLLEFHRRNGGTILYVTHDQSEALALADRMAILSEGKILEIGKPQDLYAKPQKMETALFLGEMNVFRGPNAILALQGQALEATPQAHSGDKTMLCIRPENVRWQRAKKVREEIAALPGTLVFVEFMGAYACLAVDTQAGRVLLRAGIAETEGLEPGMALSLQFPIEHRLWY